MPSLSAVVNSSLLLPLGLGLYTVTMVQRQYFITYTLTIFAAIISYIATDKLIPIFQEFTRKAGLYGKDIGKKGTSGGEKEM